MLEEVNLSLLSHDHHRVVVDVDDVLLLIVPVQDLMLFILVVEKHSTPFTFWLFNPVFVRVFDEVVVHPDHLLDLAHLVILVLGDHLGDAALVQELLGQVGQLSDQLSQGCVQITVGR